MMIKTEKAPRGKEEAARVETLAPSELSDEQIELWSNWQREQWSLASPLFRPELVRAVARHRGGVEVAVVRQGDETIGFFPFHREGRMGAPYAGQLCDVQGLIAAPSADISARDLLRGCRLSNWRFDHLVASQPAFEPYHHVTDESPFMDLSQGFDAYKEERRVAGSDELREALRKGRKIQRDIGPLRFEPYCTDPHVLDTLIQWKTNQLERMKVWNPLSAPWVAPLLRDLVNRRDQNFAGMLSAVYVGDNLLAASMSVRSEHVVHGWLTAFNNDYRKYSPGLLLVVELARAAESLGVKRIDMGKGTEKYKKSFRSGAVTLAEGVVELRPLRAAANKAWLRTREWLKSSPLGQQAKTMANRFRFARQRMMEGPG